MLISTRTYDGFVLATGHPVVYNAGTLDSPFLVAGLVGDVDDGDDGYDSLLQLNNASLGQMGNGQGGGTAANFVAGMPAPSTLGAMQWCRLPGAPTAPAS